jgi:hypothetical protein
LAGFFVLLPLDEGLFLRATVLPSLAAGLSRFVRFRVVIVR